MTARLSTHVYDPRLDGGAMSWLLGSDVFLTTWILAWDRHALWTDPLGLLDANIFHPAAWSLAYSENLLGAMPLYLPVSLVAPDPITAHQSTLVLTFALAFAFAAWLVWTWTRCLGAALVAGAAFAFSPFRVGNLASFHIEGNFLLALLPLLAWRIVDRRDRLAAVLLAIVLLMQTLYSYYLGYAAFLTMGVMALVRGARSDRRGVLALAAPILGAAAVAAVATIPYLIVRREGAIAAPSPELLATGAATLFHTGSTPALAIALLTLPFWRRGLRAPALGIWLAALAATAVVAHAMALGPDVVIAGRVLPGPYRLLGAVVPGFDAVRVPVRFNAAVSMAAAALAGVGIAGVRTRLLRGVSERTATIAAAAIAAALIHLSVPEPLRTIPATMTPQERATAEWLVGRPPAPLLEVPFVDGEYGGPRQVRVARAMYDSTRHWHRLLNGYSGYFPASYRPVAALTTALPDPRAVSLLARTTGVRHVVLHRAELSREQRRRWRTAEGGGLRVRAVIGSDVIYAPNPSIVPDLLDELVDPTPRPTTLQGTPRQPLPPTARAGEIRLDRPLPAWVPRGFPFDLPVTVRNVSAQRWPSLSPTPEHLVGLDYRWEDMAGRQLAAGDRTQPLPWDLAPGEQVATSILVRPPRASGSVRLVIGLVQDGAWFPGPIDAGTIVMPITGAPSSTAGTPPPPSPTAASPR